jgi:hypothetical protein
MQIKLSVFPAQAETRRITLTRIFHQCFVAACGCGFSLFECVIVEEVVLRAQFPLTPKLSQSRERVVREVNLSPEAAWKKAF